MESIPQEIASKILFLVDFNTLLSFRRVSKKLREFTLDDKLWERFCIYKGKDKFMVNYFVQAVWDRYRYNNEVAKIGVGRADRRIAATFHNAFIGAIKNKSNDSWYMSFKDIWIEYCNRRGVPHDYDPTLPINRNERRRQSKSMKKYDADEKKRIELENVIYNDQLIHPEYNMETAKHAMRRQERKERKQKKKLW